MKYLVLCLVSLLWAGTANSAEILSASARKSGVGYATVSVKYSFDKSDRSDLVLGFEFRPEGGPNCFRAILDIENQKSVSQFTMRCNIQTGAKSGEVVLVTLRTKGFPKFKRVTID